jgi:hypothetical protein
MLDDIVEPLVKLSEIAKLENCVKRTIANRVKEGRYPPPDFPAQRKGEPDLWLQSTVRAARESRRATRSAQT